MYVILRRIISMTVASVFVFVCMCSVFYSVSPARMAAALIAALGLDQLDMQSSSFAVLERGNADSSFVLSCFMWECLVGRSARESRANGLLLPRTSETSTAVLLLSCHHSAAHFRNQTLKLGCVFLHPF